MLFYLPDQKVSLPFFFPPQAPSKLLGSEYYFCTVTQPMPMPKIHTFFYLVFY